MSLWATNQKRTLNIELYVWLPSYIDLKKFRIFSKVFVESFKLQAIIFN